MMLYFMFNQIIKPFVVDRNLVGEEKKKSREALCTDMRAELHIAGGIHPIEISLLC